MLFLCFIILENHGREEFIWGYFPIWAQSPLQLLASVSTGTKPLYWQHDLTGYTTVATTQPPLWLWWIKVLLTSSNHIQFLFGFEAQRLGSPLSSLILNFSPHLYNRHLETILDFMTSANVSHNLKNFWDFNSVRHKPCTCEWIQPIGWGRIGDLFCVHLYQINLVIVWPWIRQFIFKDFTIFPFLLTW